jgi:hypothetical protein
VVHRSPQSSTRLLTEPNELLTENAPVITELLTSGASIEADIGDLEREIRHRRSKMTQIDPTIRPEPAPGQAGHEPVPAISPLHNGGVDQASPDRIPGGHRRTMRRWYQQQHIDSDFNGRFPQAVNTSLRIQRYKTESIVVSGYQSCWVHQCRIVADGRLSDDGP